MKKLFAILLIVCCFSMSAKSLPKAMLLSAVMPGSGEIYSGNLTKGIMFAALDLSTIYGVNRFSMEVKLLQDSYKQFAYAKAGISTNSDNSYYELIHKWYSSDEYNADVKLYFRNLGLAKYNDPEYYNSEILYYSIPNEDAWHWNNNIDWKQYRSIRKDKQTQLMNRKLCIGIVIANRVISMIDAAIMIKKNKPVNNTSINLFPDFARNGAMLNIDWEF